jgi:hypothetical protein
MRGAGDDGTALAVLAARAEHSRPRPLGEARPDSDLDLLVVVAHLGDVLRSALREENAVYERDA